jgi:hypothetical protein
MRSTPASTHRPRYSCAVLEISRQIGVPPESFARLAAESLAESCLEDEELLLSVVRQCYLQERERQKATQSLPQHSFCFT